MFHFVGIAVIVKKLWRLQMSYILLILRMLRINLNIGDHTAEIVDIADIVDVVSIVDVADIVVWILRIFGILRMSQILLIF